MVEASITKAVVYGVLSAVAVNLGKAFQKYGVSAFVEPGRFYAPGKRLRVFVWILGGGGLAGSALLLFKACAYGPVSLIAALSGTGLVALGLFSHFVLREPIGRTEIFAMAAIAVGTALVGYFDHWPGATPFGLANAANETFSRANLIAFSLAILGISTAAALAARRSRGEIFGYAFGAISGFCGGISVFYQKAAMTHCACDDIFADISGALVNPYFYLFIVSGLLDFLFTQFALARSRAAVVVPCYQSFYMLVPFLGGLIAFYERVNGIQGIGIALLLGGAVLLSAGIARNDVAAPAIADA